MACDKQVAKFLEICQNINFPVSIKKTFFGRRIIAFLGLLLDMQAQKIYIPLDKIERTVRLINKMLSSKRNKTTVREMQKLIGHLNFLCKAIVPGRVFTRHLYNQVSSKLKAHHHVDLQHEIKEDLKMWLLFLNHESVFARDFADFSLHNTSTELDWYTDASTTLGCGGHFNTHWFIMEWDEEVLKLDPSINYLELYAVAISVINWAHLVKNSRIILFCDNMSVVHMINNTTSSCKNCMVLLRMITVRGLINNVKISAKHVIGETNVYADNLSRLRYDNFRKLARKNDKRFDKKPCRIPEELYPLSKIWIE